MDGPYHKCKISSSPIVNVIVTDRGNDDYADTFSIGVMVWFRLKRHEIKVTHRWRSLFVSSLDNMSNQ
jgi:hypothetical protein